MLVIRLARVGRKNYPVYRIVAADSRRAATAKNVAILGHYNPHTKELVVKKDEALAYIKNGAQPSNAVAKLLKSEKVTLPKWVEITTRKRAPKKEVVEAPTAPAAEKAEDAAEPAEAAEAAPEVAETAPEAAETPAEETAVVAEAAADNAETIAENDTPDDQVETVETTEESAE